MRCVIADNRQEADALWRSALARTGWTGALAATTEEARLALESMPFDLAIVDMMLEHGRGPIVMDFAAEQDVPVLLMADDLTLCSGVAMAMAPPMATVVPRALTLGEAEALLRNHADPAPAARLRAIRVPGLAAEPSVAGATNTLASPSCRSGPESGKASPPSQPANRSVPSSRG